MENKPKSIFYVLGDQVGDRLTAEHGGMIGAALRRKKNMRSEAAALAAASVILLSDYHGFAHNMGIDLKYPERHLWDINVLPDYVSITRQNSVGPASVLTAEVHEMAGVTCITCPGVVAGHVAPMVFLEKLADFLAEDLLR